MICEHDLLVVSMVQDARMHHRHLIHSELLIRSVRGGSLDTVSNVKTRRVPYFKLRLYFIHEAAQHLVDEPSVNLIGDILKGPFGVTGLNKIFFGSMPP